MQCLVSFGCPGTLSHTGVIRLAAARPPTSFVSSECPLVASHEYQRRGPKPSRAGVYEPALLNPLRQHQALGGGEVVFGEEVQEAKIVPGDLGAHGLDVKGGAAARFARLSMLT